LSSVDEYFSERVRVGSLKPLLGVGSAMLAAAASSN